MKILAFAFQNNISEQVLDQLPIETKLVLGPNIAIDLGNLIQLIIVMKPDHILGLGSYSGRDKDKLRIELKCTNKFRNAIYGEQIVELELPNFLKLVEDTKYARGIGNSWCNFVSYFLMKDLKESKSKAKYSFVHIPNTFEIKQSADRINKMIMNIKK